MARIAIYGGTGFAGSAIAAVAAERGHEVVSYTRTAPTDPIDGVRYEIGSLVDADGRKAVLVDSDVVFVAAAPRGDMQTAYGDGVRALAADAAEAGVRIGVIGGAGSSQVAPGGPLLMDGDEFPAEYRGEAEIARQLLDDLRAGDGRLDWFVVSPPAMFGAGAIAPVTGTYRDGGDVLVVADDGESSISAEDFALAVVDEIERGAHRRQRFTVGR